MLKESMVLDMNMPNSTASKYRRQKLTEVKGEVAKSTTIVGGFTPLSVIDRKISKNIVELNSTTNTGPN